jgi:hypothetical protein
MSGQGASIALIGAYVPAGELATACGTHLRAFAEFESADAALCRSQSGAGTQIAKLMKPGERKSVVNWLLKQLMRRMPGRMTEWIINRSIERITQAAKAIRLKGYSPFLKSKERPA